MDLTAHAPRGLDAELEGYAWLPRMLDKARATLAGKAGRYQFGCPVDHTCMARLGVTPELVLDLAARHADDRAVLGALRAHGIPPAAEAWFDGQAVEDELQQTGNYLRVRDQDGAPRGRGRPGFQRRSARRRRQRRVHRRRTRSRAGSRTLTRSRRWSQFRKARRRSFSASSRRGSCGPARSSASQRESLIAGSPGPAACGRSPPTVPRRS